MKSGTHEVIILVQNKFLNANSLRYRAVCILENANKGISKLITAIANSQPSEPTSFAIGFAKTEIPAQINKDSNR